MIEVLVANTTNLKKYAKELLGVEYTPERAKALLKCTNIAQFNEVLKTHGVEGYYCTRKPELSFMYCNMGDPYIRTILEFKGKLRIGTYAEIVENNMDFF